MLSVLEHLNIWDQDSDLLLIDSQTGEEIIIPSQDQTFCFNKWMAQILSEWGESGVTKMLNQPSPIGDEGELSLTW